MEGDAGFGSCLNGNGQLARPQVLPPNPPLLEVPWIEAGGSVAAAGFLQSARPSEDPRACRRPVSSPPTRRSSLNPHRRASVAVINVSSSSSPSEALPLRRRPYAFAHAVSISSPATPAGALPPPAFPKRDHSRLAREPAGDHIPGHHSRLPLSPKRQAQNTDGRLEFVFEVLERAERHLCEEAVVRFDAGYSGEARMAALEGAGHPLRGPRCGTTRC